MFSWTDSPSPFVESKGMEQQPLRHDSRAMAQRMHMLRKALEAEVGTRTQAEFARWLGISPTAWGNYESQGMRPRVDEANKIVSKTGASLDWIYNGDTRGLTHHLALRLEQALAAPPAQSKRA